MGHMNFIAQQLVLKTRPAMIAINIQFFHQKLNIVALIIIMIVYGIWFNIKKNKIVITEMY